MFVYGVDKAREDALAKRVMTSQPSQEIACECREKTRCAPAPYRWLNCTRDRWSLEERGPRQNRLGVEVPPGVLLTRSHEKTLDWVPSVVYHVSRTIN